jgi:hypothetical protein
MRYCSRYSDLLRWTVRGSNTSGGEIFQTHPEACLAFDTGCTQRFTTGKRPRHDVDHPIHSGVESELYSTWHVTVQPVSIHWKWNTTTLVSASTVEWIIGSEWWIYVVLFSLSLHCMFILISTVHYKLITIHYNKHVHSIYHIFTFPRIYFHLTVFALLQVQRKESVSQN